MRAKLSLAVASVLVSALAATAPAEAACKRFGFTVNDYGKDGPTRDAQNLLDKFHITSWSDMRDLSNVIVTTNDAREIGVGIETRF